MKSVLIRSFSGPYFSTFGLNTETLNRWRIRIWSECEEIKTRKTPNMNTFHAMIVSKIVHILRHFHEKNDSNYLRESVTVYSFVLLKVLPVCVKLYYSISGRWFILISPKNSGKWLVFQFFRKPWYATKRQHWPKMG